MAICPALRAILAVLEDETTNDITKWRNLCFTQIARLRIAEFHHYQDGIRYQQSREQLQRESTRISDELQAVLEVKAGLEAALAKSSQIQRQFTLKFEKLRSGADTDTVLLVALEKAPQVFMNIYQGHLASRLPDIERRFKQANKEISSLSTRVDGIQRKLQILLQMLQNRRDENRQSELLRNRRQAEISELKDSFARIELPTFSPEIDRIASQYGNSTEAAKMLFSIANAITELETKISAIHLDNRPSECAILEGLIEKEKISQNALLQNIVEKYDTAEIDEETENARIAVQELSAELESARESTQAKTSQISAKLKRRSGQFKAQIAENEETINALRDEIQELSLRVPKRTQAQMFSCGTDPVFAHPRFF
jgi:chromosome segregation ATPase